MDLSRGHIDDLMNATFGPAYVTPVVPDSVTWQTAEYFEGPVLSTGTFSVVNDPIEEFSAGSIKVMLAEDDRIGGTPTDGGTIYVDGGPDGGVPRTNTPFSDPYIPFNTLGLYISFAPSTVAGGVEYKIVGFSSIGLLVTESGDVGNTPAAPNYEPYFVISAVNLGLHPGLQVKFARYGEFIGTLGSGIPGAGSLGIPGSSPTPNDFNGDGKADILWRNANGTLIDWTMGGATISTSNGVAATPDASWSVAGTSDFNGDGKADILWRNTNGTLIDWSMNGSVISASNVIAAVPDSSWKVAGTGDFNGDGKADILWRNANGTLADWTMNGATISSSSDLAAAPDASWSVAGIGDFNGDGKADILWRNTNGTLIDWSMNGATISSGALAAAPDASWSIAGIGDFNGDGKADILWRNAGGTLVEWQMNGSTITSSQTVAAAPDATWSVVEIGDFNGDRKADILWRNTDGTLIDWTMGGATIAASNIVAAAPDSTWQTQAKPIDFA